MLRTTICFAFILVASLTVTAQKDNTDLLGQLEKEIMADKKKEISYATASFKTTRLINGHTIENAGKGVMDVKISHRFGKINQVVYELFGLDNATMRMGIDYGITRTLMAGIGRSTFEKILDVFFKLKLLSQSTGRKNIPVTISYVPAITLKTVKYENSTRKNYYTSRLAYSHQLLIGRKFSKGFSLQLMSTMVQHNLVTYTTEPNDLYS